MAELKDWQALGGGNSGCCGNAAHVYGFHCPGYAVPTSDYSRSHEPGLPYNMNWACAGDFAHNGNPGLRARHATLLSELMAGKHPMICEFIGMPYAGKPVYYWARWNGVKTLQRYTGAGHTTWSHISWWRSRANERAHLFSAAPSEPPPVKPPAGHIPPKYAGRELSRNPDVFDTQVRTWQAQMSARGWTIDVDGYFGNQTFRVVMAFQYEKNLGADGIIGPVTWDAAWTAPIT